MAGRKPRTNEKSQFQPNPTLLKIKKQVYDGLESAFHARARAWQNVLLTEDPSEKLLLNITYTLAIHGYVPSEDKNFIWGRHSPAINISPIVLLNDKLDENETLASRADSLEVATYILAGVLEADSEEVSLYYPKARAGRIAQLLILSGLAKFWSRDGVNLSIEDIRNNANKMWEDGERLVTAKKLGKWIKKSKGFVI